MSLEANLENITKTCRECGYEGPLEGFRKNKKCSYGRDTLCNKCQNIRTKKRYDRCKSKERFSMGSKICRVCNVDKPISEFQNSVVTKDGYANRCKECVYNRNKELRASKKHERREYGTKVCTKCKVERDVSNFHSSKRNKDGLTAECKFCRKELYELRKLKKKNIDNNYFKECRRCGVKKGVAWYSKRSSSSDGLSDWCHICRYAYEKERMHRDILFKLNIQVRSSLNRRIKDIRENIKGDFLVKELGCTLNEFKEYMESKFYNNLKTGEKMTWYNYGRNGWHIDHIVPVSRVDLENDEAVKRLVHYTNYQPLWALDNALKGNNIPENLDEIFDFSWDGYLIKD